MTEHTEPPYSDPPWRTLRQGTAIIVGAAPCLFDDLSAAIELRPDSTIFALNEVGMALPHIDHLFCGHYYKTPFFMAGRLKKYPETDPYLVHACWQEGRMRVECVDYWWQNVASSGTSAWTCVRIARAMGFSEIILAGCPLDTSGYFNDWNTHKSDEGVPRVGYDDKHTTTRNYRHIFAQCAKTEGKKVYSMSGYSRELLGVPDG